MDTGHKESPALLRAKEDEAMKQASRAGLRMRGMLHNRCPGRCLTIDILRGERMMDTSGVRENKLTANYLYIGCMHGNRRDCLRDSHYSRFVWYGRLSNPQC